MVVVGEVDVVDSMPRLLLELMATMYIRYVCIVGNVVARWCAYVSTLHVGHGESRRAGLPTKNGDVRELVSVSKRNLCAKI